MLSPKIVLATLTMLSLCAPSFGQIQDHRYDPYDWENPDGTFTLPDDLNEVSGLSFDQAGNHLLAVQDELGEVFVLNKENGEVVRRMPFWKEGDYEGIEQVGDKIYVVKNTGTIYEISAGGTDAQHVEKYNGFLDSDNDIEGLSYWPQRHQLLLACKAKPGGGLDGNRTKAVYAFDLTSKTFIEKPLLLLDRQEVSDYLQNCQPGKDHTQICEIFDPGKEDFDLSPTALAIHPLSGHFYLTSSKGNLLLIIDATGKILHIDKLPKHLHRQPEGLCFDAAGNLYISNERKKDIPPLIHRYRYDPNRTSGR